MAQPKLADAIFICTQDQDQPCDAPDGQPLQMLVMIAAPAEANDLHVQVLAELATLFLDADFCTRLRSSKTPEAFCRAIAEREAQDDPAAEPPAPTNEPGYRLLGVTFPVVSLGNPFCPFTPIWRRKHCSRPRRPVA